MLDRKLDGTAMFLVELGRIYGMLAANYFVVLLFMTQLWKMVRESKVADCSGEFLALEPRCLRHGACLLRGHLRRCWLPPAGWRVLKVGAPSPTALRLVEFSSCPSSSRLCRSGGAVRPARGAPTDAPRATTGGPSAFAAPLSRPTALRPRLEFSRRLVFSPSCDYLHVAWASLGRARLEPGRLWPGLARSRPRVGDVGRMLHDSGQCLASLARGMHTWYRSIRSTQPRSVSSFISMRA